MPKWSRVRQPFNWAGWNWPPGFDNAENTAYAFAYVRKLSVVEQYKKGVQENWQELQQLLADAKKLEQQKRGSEALDLYLKCQPVMASLGREKSGSAITGLLGTRFNPCQPIRNAPFSSGKNTNPRQ
jgi:hypothetical protein